MEKKRLDVLLTERGLAESRAQAQRLVMAGQVRVNGEIILKPALRFPLAVSLSVDRGPRYVSRGGEKLEAALIAFRRTDLENKICADVGSSTGGFTDCLLQHGAARVFAIDVGRGQLHWKLRNSPQVVLLEETNARSVKSLPEPVGFITVDVSFISLRVLLPVIIGWYGKEGGEAIVLIKPQFEAGRDDAARGEGVIRNPLVHRQVLMDVLSFAKRQGYGVLGLIRSPLLGPKGNVEFLAHLQYPSQGDAVIPSLIEAVLSQPQKDVSLASEPEV